MCDRHARHREGRQRAETRGRRRGARDLPPVTSPSNHEAPTEIGHGQRASLGEGTQLRICRGTFSATILAPREPSARLSLPPRQSHSSNPGPLTTALRDFGMLVSDERSTAPGGRVLGWSQETKWGARIQTSVREKRSHMARTNGSVYRSAVSPQLSRARGIFCFGIFGKTPTQPARLQPRRSCPQIRCRGGPG